jgi:hypothetical protein
VIVDYLCRRLGGTLACASDAEDARWVDVSELASYDVTPSVAAVVARAVEIAARPT